tara:strand:+ start:402 stop:785 length:384 start_codon:yes stop_codon:yes gene_type:complete
LLRASSEAISSEINIERLEAGAEVENGELLVRFAESAVRGDSDLSKVRQELESKMGVHGVIEAAATISAFEGLNRIADVTGIQLDAGLADESADFRASLGLDAYSGAASTELQGTAGRANDVLGIFS